MASSRAPRRQSRRLAAAALVVIVTLAHGWLARHLPDSRLGEGAADTRPQRMDITFVRELAQAAPPEAPPKPSPPPPAARRATTPAPAASAPETPPPPAPPPAPESAPEPAPEPAPTAVAEAASAAPAAPAASEPLPAVAAASMPAASSPSPAFEWPPSTRLTYTLKGHYRGPVEGQASVEWLRSGTRYQVHFEIGVGPAFAPLIARRITSQGEITEQGLRPRRYDEETRVALRSPRRATILLEDDAIHLPSGLTLPRPPGVQDTASQFVQLTWLFTLQPQLLQPGRSIELPLALPRYVDGWTYDVIGHETLATPVGSIATLHVKPRRAPRPGVDLTAEMWVAPSLQYLPVRILIRQDGDTWIDLLLLRLPQQAAPEPRGR